jgi:cell wall-associated NlpC family hydrolase
MRSPLPPWSDLIGKPFEYGARGPDKFDCYGLVIEMHRRRGFVIPEYVSPTKLEEIAVLMAGEKRHWQLLATPEPGCVVAIRVRRMVAHVGVVISRTDFLHTWERTHGVTLEPLSLWERHIEGFYRFAP